MTHSTIITESERATRTLGRQLGKLARPGDVFLLEGNLGAGKTCLTQGLAQGLGIKTGIVSPSFVLVREHYGRLPLYHIDLYRLENRPEIAELGLDDYLYGEGLCVVEWADRALELLAPSHLFIKIDYLTENSRQMVISAHGQRYETLIEQLLKLRK